MVAGTRWLKTGASLLPYSDRPRQGLPQSAKGGTRHFFCIRHGVERFGRMCKVCSMTTEEILKDYIVSIDKEWRTGHATEHTYRGALADLLNALRPDLQTINEPKRIECGAPDFIVLKDGMPLAFVEAKDIGDGDLDGRKFKGGNKEQFDRYKSSLQHIAFTDYLDFHFYEKGESVASVRIGDEKNGHIVLLKENVGEFAARVDDLLCGAVQPIKSSKQLAEMMATKARLLEQVAYKLLVQKSGQATGIQTLMSVFKKALIPDIGVKEFADVYAQTLTYGLFAARLHDTTPDTFSRHEAMSLIPKSNPFLSQLFVYIGTQLESELEWIVDDLVMMFGASDVRKILKDYGKADAKGDPMIHFYEDFLTSYDAGLRRKRGVWYTPLPVVRYIVRAVDMILEKVFGLQDGLANKDKVEIKVERDTTHGRKATEKVVEKVHKVQMLDPATGTGTFVAECVNRVHERFVNNQGRWQDYVSKDLLPRLNGFEILMASYTMAHVKLDCVLSNTGYVHNGNQRFNVFLTNSLEEYLETNGRLFAFALGDEANAANRVKRDCPVMVVMGNPPYSGESQNKGKYIMRLMEDYKKEPGGVAKLKERNPKWLNDDYVKFIRLAQEYISRNGQGIVAFINPHGFLDNPTFRGMRWNLLKTFDDIYVLNLHGNTKKKETAPDGSKDENVFKIQQGVSINIFVKRGGATGQELAKVHYADLFGKRKDKYQFLETHMLDTVGYKDVAPVAPMYFFVPKDTEGEGAYLKGFSVAEICPVNTVGIVTANDKVLVAPTRNALQEQIDYSFPGVFDGRHVRQVGYRLFDKRWLYYDVDRIERPREKVMRHLMQPDNIALISVRQLAGKDWHHVHLADGIVDDSMVSNKSRERGYVFPLYLYNENMGQVEKLPNLDKAIYGKICAAIGVDPDKGVQPEDIFDYIYAVLHTPEYREKYKEFLKVDFPRIPYPKDGEMFRKFVACGAELRRAHLLKDGHSQSEPTAAFPIAGSNIVEEVRWEVDRVYINATQYFNAVPDAAFKFWIGGYQPAQKWLKDRKGRKLSNDDCDHYQSIILALMKTQEVMTKLSKLSKDLL